MDKPPNGFTLDYDRTTWNAGFVFTWSKVFNIWTDRRLILTVKPGQSLADSYKARTGESMWENDFILFPLPSNLEN